MPIKGTYYNATLGATPTAVTGSGATPYLGSVINATIPTSAAGLVSDSPANVANMSLSAGIYVVSYQIAINASDAQYSLSTAFVTNTTASTPYAANSVSTFQQIHSSTYATGQLIVTNSFILTVTATTYYLKYVGKFAGNSQIPFNTNVNDYFRALRIG